MTQQYYTIARSTLRAFLLLTLMVTVSATADATNFTLRVDNNSCTSPIMVKAEYSASGTWSSLGTLGTATIYANGTPWTPVYTLNPGYQVRIFWGPISTPQTYPNSMYMEDGNLTYAVTASTPQSTPWFEPMPRVSVSYGAGAYLWPNEYNDYPYDDWQQYATGYFEFSRTGSTASSLTVDFSYVDVSSLNPPEPFVDFVNQDDSGHRQYGSVFSQITIPTGYSSVWLYVIPLYGAQVEELEELDIQVDTSCNYKAESGYAWMYFEPY